MFNCPEVVNSYSSAVQWLRESPNLSVFVLANPDGSTAIDEAHKDEARPSRHGRAAMQGLAAVEHTISAAATHHL